MVVWMLQRHLLVQLHTYVFFVPPVPRCKKKVSEEWNILDGTLQRSPSFSDNASVTSEESLTLSTPGMLVAQHLRKPRVLTPLRSLRRNEVELVPLACEDGSPAE